MSKKDPCKGCSCMNEYGYCEMPFSDRWYACPIESEKEENKKLLEEYAEYDWKEWQRRKDGKE